MNIEQFLYGFEITNAWKKQKQQQIEQFDWFIERLQTHIAFGW